MANRKPDTKALQKHIEESIARIKANAHMDPEAARSTRTALYEWALLTIANAGLGGPRVTKKLAKLVISARDIKFRW